MGGTLMFPSTGTYEENYWISYNLLEKEDMASRYGYRLYDRMHIYC